MMINVEPIDEHNYDDAVRALCRCADRLTDLTTALFRYLGGEHSDVDREAAVAKLLHDDETEALLALAATLGKHWKDNLEIRTHPSNVYDAYLFAETFRQQKNIDVPLEMNEIQDLHEQATAEADGPYDKESEVAICSKIVARWLGIDESPA